MSFPTWLVDASANRTNKTYMINYLDISGNLYIRNGKIQTPMNSIEFNDTTGYINISNLYLYNNLLIYNPITTSNIDLVAYVNSNNTNITSINSSITTLQGKTSAQGYNSGTTTTSFAGIVECNVVSFLNSINNVNTTTFGYISGLTSSAQQQLTNNATSISTANSNITTLQTKTTNQTYTSGTNTTTWTGNVVFPATSIASTSINNTSFVDLGNYQIISGLKQFSTTPIITANLRLDGNLSLGGATVVITNAQLQRISDIGTLNTKTTNISFATPTTTISGTTQLTTGNVSGNLRLDGSLLVGTSGGTTITNTQLTYLSTLTSNVQTQLNSMISLSANNTYTGTQTYNNNITFTGTLNNKSATTFGYLDATSSIQTQIDNKANLGAFNNFTAGCQFSNQLVSLYNASGTIYGSQTELFLTGHRSWANGGAATNGSNVFEMSLDTGFYKRGLAIQGGESNTNTASAKGSIFGLYYRTYAGGGTDPTRTPIMYGTDLETGSSLDNTLTIPSSIRMYGSLKLDGGEQITQTQLGYLTTLSENIQSAVNTLKTKLTDLVWTSGTPNKTTIVNTTETSTLTFSNTLNGISTGVFSYLSGVTSSIQDQFTSMKARTPVGSIIMYLKGDLGSPFIYCDGRELNRTTAAALFAVIGTTYGAGDGSTTFNVPDMTAIFVRGVGSRTINGVAYASTTGSTLQIDAMEAHTHSSNLSGNFLKTGTSFGTGWFSGTNQPNQSAAPTNTGAVNTSNRTSNETRPINLPVYYYICAS
jgi:microcystin-dependent protein